MNTIEQAQDVAKCLRSLMCEGSAYLIAADTIDALITELNLASGELLVWRETVKHNQVELDTVWKLKEYNQAKADKLRLELASEKARHDSMVVYNDQLLAELATLKQPGLFINLIAQHEGLAEEIRTL